MDLTELQKGGRELRIDVGSLRGRGSRTPQGFLRVPANLTRTGVLTYYRADGTKFRELRHPEEVFNRDSLGTLAFAPLTERHPGGLVSPKNVASVQVGIVTDAHEAGRFAAGNVVVQNDDSIARVLSKKSTELSPGYTCRIDHTQGEWNGERYDGIQRGIVYNHLAMGPREWGRSGPEVRLKLDAKSLKDAGALVAFERYDSVDGANVFLTKQLSIRSMGVEDLATITKLDEAELWDIVAGRRAPTEQDAVLICDALGLDPALLVNQTSDADRRDQRGARKMDTRTIRVDSIDVQVQASHASVIEKAVSDRDATIATTAKRADEAEGKLDGITKERDDLKKKLDAATDPKKVASAVASRVSLEKSARKILEPDVKLDGKTDREVKVAVLLKTDEKFDAEGKSDDYVNGRFDMVVSAAPDRNHSRDDSLRTIAEGRKPPVSRTDDKDDPTDESRVDGADSAKERARLQAAQMGRKNLRVSVVQD